MTALNIEPLGPILGARIHDIDLSQHLADEVIDAIVSALGRYGVVSFPRQKLTPRQQHDFSARFGELEGNEIGRAHV